MFNGQGEQVMLLLLLLFIMQVTCVRMTTITCFSTLAGSLFLLDDNVTMDELKQVFLSFSTESFMYILCNKTEVSSKVS